LVYNKLDQTTEGPRLERDADGRPTRVWVSALTGAGLNLLNLAISDLLKGPIARGWLCLPAAAGKLRSELFRLGAVHMEQYDGAGRCWLEVAMPQVELERQCARSGVECRLSTAPEGDFLAGAAQAP
jgi:GTP-binding protein HflX